MKKLILLLSIFLLMGAACTVNKKDSKEVNQQKNEEEESEVVELVVSDSEIDAIVSRVLESEAAEMEQNMKDKLEETRQQVLATYCESDNDCIALGAPCSSKKAFNKADTQAKRDHIERTKNHKGMCTFDIKEYSDPYCQDNICKIDRIY